MADGSRALEMEADAAAAEAAREAKAEVLERAAVTIESSSLACRARRKPRQGPRQDRMVGVQGRRLDHVLQLDRVRHLQAQPQPRQVAPVHNRHGYLRRGDRERRAHRPARLSRGSLAQEYRHGQAPGVQAVQRDDQLARHHGPDDRPQPAADAGRARAAGDVLLASTSATTTTWSTWSARPTSGRCCRRTSRSSCSRTASPASTACAAISSTSAATTRSTITTTRRSAGSTARCSRSAASGTAG